MVTNHDINFDIGIEIDIDIYIEIAIAGQHRPKWEWDARFTESAVHIAGPQRSR
jgi:hypothetical protein